MTKTERAEQAALEFMAEVRAINARQGYTSVPDEDYESAAREVARAAAQLAGAG